MPSAGPPGSSSTRTLPPETSSGGGWPAGATVTRERSLPIQVQQTVVNISSDCRLETSTLSRPFSTARGPCPDRTSPRQAARSATPTAASSGPCPATSPISVATVPSGSSSAS